MYGSDALNFFVILFYIFVGMVIVGVVMLLIKRSGGGALALVGFILAVLIISLIGGQ